VKNKSAGEKFPSQARIVRSSDYRALYKEGRKVYSRRFILFIRTNDIGRSRLGLTVSRKVGGAVIRNRIKRLFREIFRKSLDEIPNQLDILINAKSGCVGTQYIELRNEFLDVMQKLRV
jgi:ribonuclease P protein component